MTVNSTDDKAGGLARLEKLDTDSALKWAVWVSDEIANLSTDEGYARRVVDRINTSADAFALKKVLMALDVVAKNCCGFCDLGWEFEVKDYGVYHKVPPENLPTIMKNVKCRAKDIRALASKIGKWEVSL